MKLASLRLLVCLLFIIFPADGQLLKITVPEHTLTGHRSLTVDNFPVEIFYENPATDDVAYIWSRVTCDIVLDIYRIDTCWQGNDTASSCTRREELFRENFPVDQTRNSETHIGNVTIHKTSYYRAMIFNRSACLHVEDCRFEFKVRAREDVHLESCEMTLKLERGLVLKYDQRKHYNETGYHAARSYNQLYALIPSNGDDFPLYVRLDTMASSRVFLEHAWGYSTTVYRSQRSGSFEVIVLLHELYRHGDYFWVWITVLNSNPYDLQIGKAEDQRTSLFFNISPFVLLISLCGLLLLSICCYKAMPAPTIELEYPTTAPPPVTQEELEMFDVTRWAGPSDDPEDLNRCTICLEDFEMGEELRILPCSHCFHMECVDHWLLRQQRRCPLCMQDVNEAVNYRDRDTSESYFTFVETECTLTE